MKKHLYIYALFLAISFGCSSVKVAETPKVIPVKPSDVFVTSHEPYEKSVNCANKLIHLDEFKSRVLAATYEQTNDNSFEVLAKVEQAKLTQVKPIWPKNPFSKMVAVVYPNDPAIYFNARKSRPVPSMAASAVHELSHKLGYKHKGNSPKGNEKTVPYALGAIAEELARKHCL